MPRIRLLGEVGLWSADEPIALRSSKQLALLALLAEAHPRPLTRRYVLDTLWPGVDPDRGRRSLNQAVYGIRRRVGADLLRVRLDLLALEGPDWTCDLWEIDELVAHGARTRTPLRRFAEGGRLPDTPGFIDWVDRSRARIDAHMVSAYCAELSKLMDRGRFEDIEPLARATLDIDPYAETALYHLAMAVAGSGRITAGLGELRAARDIFRKDLGRDLPTAFSTLEERLESAEAFEAMRRPEGEGSCPAPFAFVGREEEFSALRTSWDRIAETGRRIILVSGEPGIGKTRLVDRLARLASIQGGRVLQAECFAAHKRVPFVALSQALRGIRPEEIAQLDLIWRRVLFSAFALEAAGTDLAPPPRLDPEAEQLRLFESVVYAVQAAAAHRHVLFLIDDLQWLDQSSVAILQHLIRRCEEEPVLFVFAARERELRVDDELRAFVANNRGAHFTDVELDVLDEAASEELVRSTRHVVGQAGAEEVATIAGTLGGHPFLITETARSCLAKVGGRGAPKERRQPKVTQTLDDHFHQIFLPISGPARLVAATIAVWGDNVPADDLAKHLAILPTQLSASIRELEQAGVLANRGTVLAFKHMLYREWLYSTESSVRRAIRHKGIGEYLESKLECDHASIARHYAACGRKERARAHALKAASQLAERRAYPEALHFLELGVEASTTAEELLEAEMCVADHLYTHSSHTSARRLYEKILGSLPLDPRYHEVYYEAKARVNAMRIASASTGHASLAKESLQLFEEARNFDCDSGASIALDTVASALWHNWHSPLADEVAQAAEQIARNDETPTIRAARAARVAASLFARNGQSDRALESLSVVRRTRHSALDAASRAWLAQAEGMCSWEAGELRGASRAWAAALSEARSWGDILYVSSTLINLAVVLHYQDSGKRANAYLDEAKQHVTVHGFAAEESLIDANRLLFAYEGRDYQRVESLVEQEYSAKSSDHSCGEEVILAVKGLLLAAQGERQKARALLRRLTVDCQLSSGRYQDPSTLVRLARLSAGNDDELCQALELAERARGVPMVGRVCAWKVDLEWAEARASVGAKDDPGPTISRVASEARAGGALRIVRMAEETASRVRKMPAVQFR